MKKIFSTTGISILLGSILIFKLARFFTKKNDNTEVYETLKKVITDSYNEAKDDDYKPIEDDSYE